MGFLSLKDSGTSIAMACGRLNPDITKNSSTLSSDALSLIPGCTIGRMAFTSPSAELESTLSLASIQPRAVFALFGHGYALQKDKLVRNLEQNARTVASLVVGTLGAAVLHVLENRKRRIDQLMRLVPVNVHNHPHAASVVLILRTVQTAGTVTISFIDNSTFHSYSLSFCN